ncbi:MAG: endonuclease/exonuclease/phosphatase family protein, partial [Bacteroidota bacterium]
HQILSKDLVVLNIHNDAYDASGDLKQIQLEYLRDLAKAEYEKGNYVLVGGDWNMVPPYFKYDGFIKNPDGKYFQHNIPAELMPADWQWIYDPTEPTNRKTNTKYEPGKTFVTLIDFYLLSPNLKALQVKTIDQAFEFSDHQPVRLKVVLL